MCVSVSVSLSPSLFRLKTFVCGKWQQQADTHHSRTHTRTREHTQTQTHTHAHARTHTHIHLHTHIHPPQNQIASTLIQALHTPDDCNGECTVGKAKTLFTTCVSAQQGGVSLQSLGASVAPLLDTLSALEKGNTTMAYALAALHLSGV